MRLGVLPFGFPLDMIDALLAPLVADGVDVVPAETVIQTGKDAAREAQRIARADCDGVVLFVADSFTSPESIVEAALFLAGVPVLLTDIASSGALLDAAGALEAIGAPYDRYYSRDGSRESWEPGFVAAWLAENRKQERQRGNEAARKLYGQRLFVPNDFLSPDAALWAHQFGVILTRTFEGSDFTASDGDACGALTRMLFSFTVGAAEIITSEFDIGSGDGPLLLADFNLPVTLARITRRGGRFRCLLVQSDALRFGNLADFAVCRYLHGMSGSHIGALRSACEALDIEPIILR